jgi:hypothetical protein
MEIASATEVAYVEADTVVKTGAFVSQASAPAGLRRIHVAAGNTGYIYDNSSGSGIVAYVVDTGIKLTHTVGSSARQEKGG